MNNGASSPPHNVFNDDPRFPLIPSDTSVQRLANAKVTGNSMNLDLKFSDQRVHRIAVYMVDPDKANTRAQRVDLQVIDRETGQFRTLASQTVTNFANGKYVVFNAKQTSDAAVDVRVKITRVAGPTAVANAVFVE